MDSVPGETNYDRKRTKKLIFLYFKECKMSNKLRFVVTDLNKTNCKKLNIGKYFHVFLSQKLFKIIRYNNRPP